MDKVNKTDAEWRAQLDEATYRVTRKGATEPPFSGKYVDHHEGGTYTCAACGAPLFASDAKYDSGSGWPSFFAPLDAEGVVTALDESLGMRRIEIRCARCDAHLGHLFDDGPNPTGRRYCVNSASLAFDPEDG